MEAGNNLEQSVALIAAANKVVQDPNSVGSALRTISLRLRGTSVSVLEEMGEETDGVVESVSKMQEKIQALTGVNILTDSGAYKETYEILREIGTVWEDMSDIDQAALLELMAGKNRANTLAAILGNMEDLEGAYESALGAEGSAMRENERYLESLQGHIDVFNNSLQTMWMNLLNTDAIKWFVHLGDAIIKIVDHVGVLTTAFTVLGGLFVKKNWGNLLFGNVVSATKNINQLQDAVDSAKQKWESSKSSKDYDAYQKELKNFEAYKAEFGSQQNVQTTIENNTGNVGQQVHIEVQPRKTSNISTQPIQQSATKAADTVVESIAQAVDDSVQAVPAPTIPTQPMQEVANTIADVGAKAAADAANAIPTPTVPVQPIQQATAHIAETAIEAGVKAATSANHTQMIPASGSSKKKKKLEWVFNSNATGNAYLLPLEDNVKTHEYSFMTNDDDSIDLDLEEHKGFYQGNKQLEENLNLLYDFVVDGKKVDHIPSGYYSYDDIDIMRKPTARRIDGGNYLPTSKGEMHLYTMSEAGEAAKQAAIELKNFQQQKNEVLSDVATSTSAVPLEGLFGDPNDIDQQIAQVIDKMKSLSPEIEQTKKQLFDLQDAGAPTDDVEKHLDELFQQSSEYNEELKKLQKQKDEALLSQTKQSTDTVVETVVGDKDDIQNVVQGYAEVIEDNLTIDTSGVTAQIDDVQVKLHEAKDTLTGEDMPNAEFGFDEVEDSIDKLGNTGEGVSEKLSSGLGDIKDATDDVGDSANVVGDKISGSFDKAKTATARLWAQVKQLAQSMLTMYAISTVFELLGDAISFVTDKIKESSNSAEALNDKYQEASDKLSDCQSELRDLESELDTINGQIDELISQGTLTYAEQEELDRLQNISAELERQIALKQTLEGNLQAGVNANAVNAGNAYLNTSFDSEQSKTERQDEAEESGKKWGKGAGLTIGAAVGAAIALGAAGFFTGGATWAGIPAALSSGIGTIGMSAGIGAMSGELIGGVVGTASEGAKYDQEQTVENAINTMNETRDKLIKARDEAYEAYVSSPTDTDKMEEYESAAQALSLYDGKMADHISQMSQYYNTITSNWDNATDDQKATAKHYGDLLDKYNVVMGGAGAKNNALDRIFGANASEELQSIKEQILDATKTGEEFDFETAINSSQELKDVLTYLGLEANDVKNYFTQIGEAAKKSVENDINPTQTYSELSSGIESYNEVLSQTSEIVSDNTEVTQEYKDSLTALGISNEELGECFDENNGLIVKNADKLKDLIKKQKDEYKNNVKTAKSQAKLKYYKLAKDLVNTVKSTKNLTNTQRDHIKAILEEMDAVQDTISKYNMLEAELLGVTNAYKKLADAQEIDSATDYGSKAEEMVNALANAFNTGELGTAAAEAAFEGLIPDWVVANAQSVDEAMQSAYNYMKSGALSNLFDIKYDDDGKLESVQMTLDKVKAFTSALTEADTVFHGTWDEFTLDPAIQNLDDFANAIGVTKEVAFAYLTELERYDASNIFGDSATGLLDQLMGDNFDHVMQQASQKYAQAAADMAEEFNQVNSKVNMFNRKILYDDEGKMVTMASETLKASDVGLDGDFAFNVTPILPDGTMLEDVEDYIRKHLASGGKLEDMDIFLGSYATLDEAIAKAKRLSELQGVFYENQLAIEEMENKALDFASAWGKTSDQLTDAREEAESLGRELAGAKNGVNESTGRTVEEIEADIKKNDQLISDLLSNLDKLKNEFGGEPTEMVVGVALDEVQEDIDNFKKDLEKKPAELKAAITEIDSTGFENLGLTKNADGSWSGLAELDWYQKLDPASQAEVTNYLNMVESEHYLNLLMGDGVPTIEEHLQTISTVLQDIARMMNPTYTLNADTATATSNVMTFKSWWNSLGDKVVTLYQRTIGSWFGGDNINGTANVGGTAYAGGKWGASKTEQSLVGELGPEMIVRGNRWFTVGENGAEFTQVKKGDIIFNHRQTEELLKNGHVTGRGKAYASGTAYAGINTFTPYVPPSVSSGGGGDSSDSDDNDNDYDDDAEQVVDFIEMKLEEIEAIIEKTSTRIANFLDDTTSIKSKDELYDELVKAEKDKSEAYLKAAQKYNVEAAAALSGVPQKYQEMARNGAIEIKDFIGEDQVEIAEKIQEYRDWAAKADEAENGHLEAIAAISAHRVEQLEDIATDFENIVSISKSHSDLLQAEMDLIEESGNRLSESYYEEIKRHSQKQLDDMQNERVALQKILDDAVAAGDVIIGSDDWYSMLETIYEVDQEIVDCKTNLEEFQNAINDLYWDGFDKLIDEIDNVDSELSNLYDLISDADNVVDDMGNWTDEGITALGLLAQQMENAQFKSQEYGDAIAKLKKDYANGLYSTDEYNEKLADLTDSQYDAIKSYEDAKDAIVDLNKTRAEAVKKYMQEEIDKYGELIEKKKESLNTDKEARDFEKSVQESNKNIKDIERQIAALQGNTSSSAMAQRKRLEAELLKAREELNDLYYDHSVEKQQEALDKELEDYTKNKEDQMDALDEYLEKEEQVIADSFDLIAENTKSIVDTLISVSEEYGVTISDTITTPWISGANAIGRYEEQLDTSISATTKNLEVLKQQLENLQTQADKTAESIVNATHSTIVSTNGGHQTSIKGYAKGSKSVEYDQWALIDELGDELQITPDGSGRLAYIKKGTGILNNTLTERLMDLAMDPTSMIENNRPVIGTPGITTTNNTITIDASVGTLLSVEHLDGNNPVEIAKLVDKAWEKKMQTLNNSIKKFTR